MAFSRANIDELRRDYEAAYQWLKTLCGDSRVQQSRFGRYSQDLELVSEKIRTHENLEPNEGMRLATLLEECNYLNSIHNGLADHHEADSLSQVLAFVVSGTYQRANEHPGEPSRNMAFELSVAARLANSGFIINLTEVTDIVALLDGHEFLIECKRPTSLDAVERNYARAKRQLSRRFENHPNSTGVVAMSVSVAMNPEGNFIRANSLKIVENLVNGQQNEFHRHLAGIVRNMHNQSRIPRQCEGVLTEFVCVAELGVERLPTTIADIVIVPTWDAGDPISRVADALNADRVQNFE